MKLTARSVWNERAVRTSTCLHCAHEWVCVDVSANRLSTPPLMSSFSFDLFSPFEWVFLPPLPPTLFTPSISSLCSCSSMNRWNVWIRRA